MKKKVAFWGSGALLAYTQVGYPALLGVLARILPPQTETATPPATSPPSVSLIVAAHDEETVIAAKVADALAQDYPRERLEVIVCCDGCADATAQRARQAGADVVLELPRGGKICAQDAGVARARGDLVAFSDANARWEPAALRHLIDAFADPQVGYACGHVSFVDDDGPRTTAQRAARAGAPRATNQEGLYWRYEMAVRSLESRLASITAGNGAIYATRRESYLVVDPIMGHDLSLPFNMVKRGWRAIYVPAARATEKMVPTVDGEFARKRRMMSHTWPIVVRGGLLSPRGYGPLYTLMIVSHRLLRYLSPAVHGVLLLSSVALLGQGRVFTAAVIVQGAVLVAAALAPRRRGRALLVARYYVLTTASPAAGLWDWLRHGTQAGWEAAEGTR